MLAIVLAVAVSVFACVAFRFFRTRIESPRGRRRREYTAVELAER